MEVSGGENNVQRRQHWPIAAAIAIYFLFGFLLIAQKAGLQYDEAMLVAGAVHMQHSPDAFELDNTPNAWVCPFHRCLPLMSFIYVGALKEYASLPLFAIFGPRTWVIRLVALLFGAIGIWGIYRFVDSGFGRWAAAASAFALAINPAFLNMVVFDNGATSALMGMLGITCAAAAVYATRKSTMAAFGFGLAMGLGVWTRANFVYILIAGGIAAAIVFRRRILIPRAHVPAMALGGVIGGFPFIVYQFVSHLATWRAQTLFEVSQPIMARLHERFSLLADTLLSDGEHRRMWDGPPLPAWQFWFFPSVVFLACLVCLFRWRGEETQRRSFAQFLTLTFLITLGILMVARLPVAEHHLIFVVPFAVAVTAMSCSILQGRSHYAWFVSAIVLCAYAGSAVDWEVRTVRGLSQSGGRAVWSNAGIELARYLDRDFRDRQIKMLDWGFQYNLYVLADGRLKPVEIESPSTEDLSAWGRPWIDEIREGGVFVLHGPGDRVYPKSATGFLKALATARPTILHSQRFTEHDGTTTYARVIDIAPNSIHGQPEPGGLTSSAEVHIPMNSSQFDAQLSGFYAPEEGGFRWTKREFSATLDLSNLARVNGAGDLTLLLRFYIPDEAIQRLGSVTLQARFGVHTLAPETFTHGGQCIFRRPVDDSWITPDPVRVDFSLDKPLHEPGADPRVLGLAVTEVSVEPE